MATTISRAKLWLFVLRRLLKLRNGVVQLLLKLNLVASAPRATTTTTTTTTTFPRRHINPSSSHLPPDLSGIIATTHPAYPTILARLRSSSRLLHIGPDGAPADRLAGDFDTVIMTDTSNSNSKSWAAQVAAGERLVRRCAPSLVVGRQAGSRRPLRVEQSEARGAGFVYLHDVESLRVLWNEIGARTGTRWDVAGRMVEEEAFGGGGGAPRTFVEFAVSRVCRVAPPRASGC